MFIVLKFTDMPKMDILIGIVQQIESLLSKLVENNMSVSDAVCGVCHSKEPEEVLRKQQVIDILKISDRTYYRHIENGILVPRQLGNRSYFYPSDLVDALEYSRVHGYL